IPILATRLPSTCRAHEPYSTQTFGPQRRISSHWRSSANCTQTRCSGSVTWAPKARDSSRSLTAILERSVRRSRSALTTRLPSLSPFCDVLGAGAHYTWSSFIDSASDPFNASVRGEVAIAQNPFDRKADRARSTYDRPQRFSVNAVYELPSYRSQGGAWG